MHVAIEFKEPVSGVVAVGAGRYAGLGIFANLRL
jgi:CRISPR-associated protein Csb2